MYTDSSRSHSTMPSTTSQQNTEHRLNSSAITTEANNHQPAPQQLGRWLHYQIQRVPGRVMIALLNHFSVDTVDQLADFLTLSVSVLVSREIFDMHDELEVTTPNSLNMYASIAGLCTLGIYQLRQNFDHYLEQLVIQSLDANDESVPPTQLLTWVADRTGCHRDVKEKLLEEMTTEHLSGTHFRVLLNVFKTVLFIEMDDRSAQLLKIRNILTTVSLHPELVTAAATQAIMQRGQCHDSTLNVLDRVNAWMQAETLFLPLETGHDTSWRNLLLRIQSTYNEWVLVETMYSVKYQGWSLLRNDQSLGEHSQSAMIFSIYKRLLHRCGVCKFLSVPPKIVHNLLVCYFFVPDASVFYQFQQVFLQKLHDTDAFFQFAKQLMTEKETTLLKHDPQLRLRINNKRDQNVSRLDHLLHLQNHHRITAREYLDYSQRLMSRHHQELDDIWLDYISRLFSRIPARLKNSGSRRQVPANLSLIQLINRYN